MRRQYSFRHPKKYRGEKEYASYAEKRLENSRRRLET
jgi:hypothetical protein